ncbi:MAG: hypothetical protein Q9183_007715, partial [Haloplaca sp. 2 TL-2023]
YKALGGVAFVNDIPRTPSGKLQKFKLREMCTNLARKKKRKSEVLDINSEGNGATRNGNHVNGNPKPLEVEQPDDASRLMAGVKRNGMNSKGMARAIKGDKSEDITELGGGQDTTEQYRNGHHTRKRVKTSAAEDVGT